MAIYRVNKQDVCRFYKEDFWGELRIRRNVYARINKFLFGRKKRKFDNSTRFDVIKLDNTRFKRRKRLTKEEIRYIQKEKIKHYFLNLSEYGLRAILLRTKSIKTSKGQNYRERNVRDAFTNRLDHLIFSFGWATSLGHARTLIKKGAIQVNHFIPTRIDFIPMPGDEIQVRKTYKPIIRRKLIGLRQKRLKIDFKLNRLRLIYYLFNVRKKRWKNVRPKFFYNKLKLFRHPRIRWLNYTTTNRYYRFYKNTPTRFSKLLNSFHPKNFNRIKTRFAYPFIPDSNTYHSYIKNRLLKLRDLEYKYEENTPPNNFSWLYKLRRMSPSKIRRLLKKDANVTEDGTEVFRKDFIPQTNRERLHSRHSYNRPDANKNSKQKNNKSFKNQKWRKKKKFNKYVSDQTVLESNLFFRNRWLYFKIINNPAKRARVRELDKKLAYAARHKQEFDNFITSNKSIYNQPLAALKSEIDLFDSLLGLDDIGSGCRAPLYWAELFRYLIVTVFSYRDVKSNKDEYFGPKSLLLKSMLNPQSVNGVGTKQNKDENKDENKDDDVENHEYLHLLSSKIIKIIFTKAKLSSTEPTELKFKIGLAAFVNYLQCQQSGLNHFVNLLNNKKNDFGQLFSFSFGPSSVNSLYKFTRDILNWPTFFSLNSEKNPYIILHQLRFNHWRSNHTNSYRLLKGVIEHYYSYFAFFYSKSNFLTIKKKGALHYFLRFLKHLLRPKVTPEQRLLALKFPNLIPRPYRKKAVGFTSIAEARRSAKDRAMPIFISDYSIPLLMARVKTVRGILYPQFEALARNILKVNKTLIKTFIKDSSSLIPSKWLNLPKLRKSRYKITSKFLTRLILRLSRRLGIPVFNRPIYNLKLGIRGRAKQLLDKQVNLIENTTFPNYNRLYYPTKIKRFNRKLKRLKRRALRVRYRTLIARRFPNFIINYKLLLAIYLGPKRMFKNRRFKHRTRRAKLRLKRTLRFRRRKNKLFRVNRRKKRHFFYYFPFKFNLKTILTYYGNGKRSERLNRENDVYVTYPTTPYNLRY